MTAKSDFRLDIQGLRALAVLSVVLFHANETWIPGGFVGVDIFFVISGFLITRILIRELREGRFSIAGFYARRVKRIFPALFLMLGATLLLGWALLPPDDLKRLGEASIATVIFVSNLHFLQSSGYFAPDAELNPLLHTWSLAVEEQFYLTFPILLWLLWKFARQWLAVCLWGLSAISLAFCVYWISKDPSGAFYLPHARAYELLIGAILAAGALPRLRSALWRDVLSVLGLALIVYALVALDSYSIFPGLNALWPCIGTALIIFAGEKADGTPRQSWAGRVLSLPVIVFFGTISYSLYLWHWPLIVYARYWTLGQMDAAWIVAALAGSVLLAWLSYRFVENPVLRLRATQLRVLSVGVAAIGAGAVLGGGLVMANGLPGRFTKDEKGLLAASRDSNRMRRTCHVGVSREIAYQDTCTFGKEGAPAGVAVWADSAGAELVVALGEKAAPLGFAARQLSASICPPSLGFDVPERPDCVAHNQRTLEALLADDTVHTVMLAAAFNRYEHSRHAQLAEGMADAARQLNAAGKRIVLVYPAPFPDFPVPMGLSLSSYYGRDPALFGVRAQDHKADYAAILAAYDALAGEVDALVLRPDEVLCQAERCLTRAPDGRVIYFDSYHLSVSGAAYVLENGGLELETLFQPH